MFARYLVGREPSAEIVERYERASRVLFGPPPGGADAALLAYVRRQAWSVPFLDAASGILRPGSALRNRLLVMAALLETSTPHAGEFMPRSASLLSLLLQLALHGLRAIVGLVVGLPVYWVATRSGR